MPGARWVALAADGFALRLNTPAEAAALVASIEATPPRRAGVHGSQSRWVSRVGGRPAAGSGPSPPVGGWPLSSLPKSTT
jgi:hypothetical protein